MVGALAKKKSAFAKAASIPARQQSENAGPRLFGLLSTKAAFAKAAFDTLQNSFFYHSMTAVLSYLNSEKD